MNEQNPPPTQRIVSQLAADAETFHLKMSQDTTSVHNQHVYYHPGYQDSAISSCQLPNGYVYTNSDYYAPATPVTAYSELPHDPYHSVSHDFGAYSQPKAVVYLPGTPVEVNHFENMKYSDNQWQQSMPAWSEGGRGSYQQYPRRSRGKPYRGNNHKNVHGYTNSFYPPDNYYKRDDYYYETPGYQYYNSQVPWRGTSNEDNQRSRQGNYQDAHFRLDDGDGKHHKRKNHSALSDPDQLSSPNQRTLTASRHVGSDPGKYRQQSGQVFDYRTSHNGSFQGTHSRNASTPTHRHSRQAENGQDHSQAGGRVPYSREDFGEKSSKGSRSDGSIGRENKDGEGVFTSSKEHASFNNARSSDPVRRTSGVCSKSADFRRGKMGSVESDTAQNDESQRATLSEQLSSSKYECMVCCDNIRPEASVWGCQNCYHVFHLSCIQKWAQSSLCKETKSWRCPGCQNLSSSIPSQYRCFCGRRRDPTYKRGEIAHSCGETCRKKRKSGCKHPCTILCHPGPCPSCCAMVWVSCDCGKVRKHVRCSAVVSFKCDKICDKKLNCEDHTCQDVCHPGPCSPCSVSKTVECFCMKTTRKVMCGTEEFQSASYCCEKICGRTLSCGNHVCEELCHPGDCATCPLMPGVLQTCSCGQTPLVQLMTMERQSCLDPVPTCGKVCNKPMSCGSAEDLHLCEKRCHAEDCGPCTKDTILKCVCGATEKKMPCEVAASYDEQNPFKCQRRCGKKKNCGRHKCSDNCCVKEVHICEIICGQKLSCGVHKCEELCHRGNCKRCLQARFEELTCYCGAEVLEPPLPCGTRPPECKRMCSRPHECNHTVRHHCHFEDACPPCTDLTDKLCMGGHMVRKNMPCHMTNISCGYPCNKLLPCGQHKCQKVCHKGDCLEDGSVCSQLCEKTRPACGHPCGALCHTGPCPDTACKTEISITCPCGNRTAKALCSIGGDQSVELTQFQRLSVQSLADGQALDLSQFSQSKKSNKRLDCDTNCGIIERNRRLALALEIKNPDMSAKLGSPTFTDFLKDYAKKNPKFALSVEKSLSELVQSAKQSAQPNRSHAFQSMNREQRRFVHELAEFYGCQTQSYDYEPVKNVVATATREKCWLPNMTLSQHVLKDQTPKVPPPISSFKTQGVTFTVLEKKKAPKETVTSSRAWEDGSATSKPEPTIDYFDFSSP